MLESVYGPTTLQGRFEQFHRDNPRVYQTLIRLTREAKALGHDRVGMKMLFEVTRWELSIKVKSDDEWKLNNSFTSRYARLVAAQEPDLRDMFDTRELRSE